MRLAVAKTLNAAANHSAGRLSLHFISVNDTSKHLWHIRHINICCSVADINLIHLAHTHTSTLSCLDAIS